ncbi:MAG: diacylglycerol kinase family protein [Bacteroidota bacterium]
MEWKKRLLSFKYAFQGLKTLFQTQPNFVIHSIFAALAILLAVLLRLTYFEWLILTLTITIVFFTEAINTALEFLTDLTSPNQHPLAGKAKDVAAAAVLITAIGAVVIGLFLFLPKLLSLLSLN